MNLLLDRKTRSGHLDRKNGGPYRSTPHRVRNPAPRDRLPFPFSFDPNFAARLTDRTRWPGASTRRLRTSAGIGRASTHSLGTYGDYLLGKIGKVFPELRTAVL